ncbi:MAG TPA: M15 family metallopeptidase [Dehalococcoidia bacterium]
MQEGRSYRPARRRPRRSRWLVAGAVAVLMVSAGAGYVALRTGGGSAGQEPPATVVARQTATGTPEPSPTAGGAATAAPSATPVPEPTAAPSVVPVRRDPLDLLVLVDKTHALPAGFEPPDLVALPQEWWSPNFGGHTLRQEAAAALVQLLQAARTAGFEVRVSSAYRSYQEQERTFQYWVSVLGLEEAQRSSARPGHSEHQLGTAVDLTSAAVDWQLVETFGATPEGRWLADHAHEYGFALSYPAGAEAVTGYVYEPWHFRYVGREAARQWRESGLTLTEFLAPYNR